MGVNDFRLIKYNGNVLTPEIFNNEHKKCLDFIKKSLNESKAKIKIIVTHHVPSDLLTAEEYIKTCGAKYWIFGHSHRNVIKKIGGTNCICNQLGYVMGGENENDNFSSDKCIDLKNDDSKCDIF